MPQIVKTYIQQVLIGFSVSAVFTGILLWQNVANLWHLVTHDPIGPLAVFLLWMFSGIVFAGLQFGLRIMSLSDDDDSGPTRGLPVRAALVPQPVKIATPKRARGL